MASLSRSHLHREKFSSVSGFGWSILFLTFIHFHIKKMKQGHSGGGHILCFFQFALAFETKCIYWANNYITIREIKKDNIITNPITLSKPFSFQILICRPWNTSIHWFLNVITTVKIKLHIIIVNPRLHFKCCCSLHVLHLQYEKKNVLLNNIPQFI